MNVLEITPENVQTLTDNVTLKESFLESGGDLWDRDLMQYIIDDLDADRVLMLCLEGGIFVGFALLNLKDPSCTHTDMCVRCVESERCLYIQLLGIHPSYRGQGKLKPLLAQIKTFALNRSFTCMRLSALNSKVAKLYEDHAFAYEVPENKKICTNMKTVLLFGRRLLRNKRKTRT